VGIAMGAGADVAMEGAGITLAKEDLRGILKARRLSQTTSKISVRIYFSLLVITLSVYQSQQESSIRILEFS
jgi:Cu+-exporting ATPase